MHPCVSFRPLFHASLVVALACAWACSPTAASLASASAVVSGTVQSEAGQPVAGVVVSLPASQRSTVTDDAGAYSLLATGAKVGDEVAVLVVHPDYARLTTRLRLGSLQQTLNLALRPHDAVQTVTLPQAGEAALVVPLSHGDGGVTLTVPAGSLATPDGTVVSGAVTLKLSYWHPNQSLSSSPAPLAGVQGGNVAAPVNLVTYGMADIELSRGNDKLQVVPGHTLSLAFVIPANLAANLVNLDPNDPGAPLLWYADETTGLWAEVGTFADATLAADANGTVVTAKLPHLSAWNLDGISQTNACVRGRVVDSCGAPVANRDLTLWLLGGGQVAQYTLTTAADGTYCGNLTGSADNGVATNRTATFNLFVSALHDPNASVCNPTGIGSFSALCTVNRGAYCAGGDVLSNTPGGPSPFNYGPGVASCKTAQVSVPLCGYCAGTEHPLSCMAATANGQVRTGPMVSDACGKVPDVVMPGCGANVPTGQQGCSAANAKHQGDTCLQDIDCCPNATLICADGLCVPTTDG